MSIAIASISFDGPPAHVPVSGAAHRPADPPRESEPGRRIDCDRLDVGSCRVLLNEARREIDRLRRGIDDSDRTGTIPPASRAADTAADRPPDALASPPPPAAPTGMPARYEASLPTPPAPLPPAIVLHLDQVVTNVGTLIDRLI